MSEIQTYTVQKVMKIFGITKHKNTIISAENKGEIPRADRSTGGHRKWQISDLPAIGEKYGFLQKLGSPKVAVVYSKKGGVFKTSIAFNLARAAALHNIKTLVIGLDDQSDITSALGHDSGVHDDMSLEEADAIVAQEDSLADMVDDDSVKPSDLIYETDLPTLDYIPESPVLDYLESVIQQKEMRDFWLLNHVIEPLKEKYELFVIDLGPAWNQLTINALVAANILISPLECKINHYRNLKYFKLKLMKFVKTTRLSFKHIYVPVKVNDAKKLSRDIKKYYISNLEDCTSIGLRSASHGEDAMTLNKSILEFAPNSPLAQEMREVLMRIWSEMATAKVESNSTLAPDKKLTLNQSL